MTQATGSNRGQLRATEDSPSIVAGPRRALLALSIGEALDRTVGRLPDKLALVSLHQGVRWTWAELGTQVDSLMKGLLKLGLQPGERIALRATNCAEWLVIQLAAAKAGLILVSLHAGCRRTDLLHALRKAGVSAIIGGRSEDRPEFIRLMETLAPEIAVSTPGSLQAAAAPSLRFAILLDGEARPGWLTYGDIVSSGRAAAVTAPVVDPKSPVSIQFTSGTTGASKAATLTHVGLLNNAVAVGDVIGMSEADAVCIPVPLHHCFGLVLGNLACVATGATMVYPSARFDPVAVLRAIEIEGCTCLYGVPTMFLSILDHPRTPRYDTSTLRTGIIAGAPCPPNVFHRARENLKIPQLTIAYGMTETSPVSFHTRISDPLQVRGETVGAILANLEAKVVDHTGSVVERGEAGELHVRGYSVMCGYWNDDVATAAAIDPDGWMHTGDLAILGHDDRLRVVGRAHDMVIRGGENIYPREVELAILGCPGVANVSVVGVEDPLYGQELCAWIEPRPGIELASGEIVAFCRQFIADHKIPRHIRFLERLPLTESGKVRTGELRKAFDLGLANLAPGAA